MVIKKVFIIKNLKALIFLFFLFFILINSQDIYAEEYEGITILSEQVTSEFPEGIRFEANFYSVEKLSDVRVFFQPISSNSPQYAYLDLFSSESSHNGDLFYRTDGNRYIPPGTIYDYWYVITTQSGKEIKTKSKSFTYIDSRYEWESVKEGPITVMYHGPMKSRAITLAKAAEESLEIMGPIIGSEIKTPIVVTLYNNNSEMISAVKSKSMTTSRELITEGQAFHSHGVVLVLAGRRDIGTITHEITHILVGRSAGSSGQVPLWLNEGLAEYGNMDKSISYIRFLEWAMDTNRLLPFSHLKTFPGDPNLILVAYGQSRSMVKFMLDNYGPKKMSNLMSELKSVSDIDKAITKIYGKDLLTLESDWRRSIGAPEYVPPEPKLNKIETLDQENEYKILTLSPDEDGTDISSVPNGDSTEVTNKNSVETVGCSSSGRSDLSLISLLILILIFYKRSNNKI